MSFEKSPSSQKAARGSREVVVGLSGRAAALGRGEAHIGRGLFCASKHSRHPQGAFGRGGGLPEIWTPRFPNHRGSGTEASGQLGGLEAINSIRNCSFLVSCWCSEDRACAEITTYFFRCGCHKSTLSVIAFSDERPSDGHRKCNLTGTTRQWSGTAGGQLAVRLPLPNGDIERTVGVNTI